MTTKTEITDKNIYKMLHPRLTILVTSIDQEERPNIITLAWSMITSFEPPMIAISVGLPRYSHDLIKNQKEFTVNIPTTEILQKTLFCGRVSGRDYDKFKITGLTPQPAEIVKPPLIKECIAHFECKVTNSMTTGDHTIFAAEIVKATANEGVYKDKYDIEKTKLVYHLGGNDFTTTQDEYTTPNWRELLPK